MSEIVEGIERVILPISKLENRILFQKAGPPKSSKKIYYEQYQLREEGGVGDAGGKREAANTPDQGEGYRATKGRAARGERAGWPA